MLQREARGINDWASARLKCWHWACGLESRAAVGSASGAQAEDSEDSFELEPRKRIKRSL